METNSMFSHDTGQRDAVFNYIPSTPMAHPQKSANAPTNRMGTTYLQPNVSVQTSQPGDRPIAVARNDVLYPGGAPALVAPPPVAPPPASPTAAPPVSDAIHASPGEEVTPSKAARMAAAFQWPTYPPSLLDRLKPYGLYA